MPFLFVILEFGFVITALTFRVLLFNAIGWESVLIGNALAAFAMGTYLWWQHGSLVKQRLTEALFADRT